MALILADLDQVNFLAINEHFTADDQQLIDAEEEALAEVFMMFSKKDWVPTDNGYPVVKSAVEHYTAAELIKNKPLKTEHAQFLIGEAERKLKKLKQNPQFASTSNQPTTTVVVPREFRTRGMNPDVDWYKSLPVNDDSNANVYAGP
jgi:hypothetical protein